MPQAAPIVCAVSVSEDDQLETRSNDIRHVIWTVTPSKGNCFVASKYQDPYT